MQLKYILGLFTILFLTNQYSFSQALPIYIDGTFPDWENVVHTQEDDPDPGQSIDFLRFSVANDNDFLFIKIEFSQEIDLTENNEIYLDIDADNNTSTGWQINGIGSEMDWNFGQRYGYLNEGSSWEYIAFPDIQLRTLPTITSNTFEIAIGRHVKPNGIDLLFTGDTIKLCFINYITNGDRIPNEGTTFTYVFDNTPVDPPEPIQLEKEENNQVRLMAYNIRNDFENDIGGLDDPERIPSLARIFTALEPDIVTINECWNTSTSTAISFLNTNLPNPNGQSWYANKADGANITASRYPILQSWIVYPDHRLTASLIDLPETYDTDILVISAHLKCCDDDYTRQLEADAFISFILDAKEPGGAVDIPQNTPFVLMGDLNLVGLSQQLTTLLTGDIQNTSIFGSGAPPDWDDTDLKDLISRQSDKRMAYTWRNDQSSYPPGRLDFIIYSNAVLDVGKAYTLQTEIMPEARLQQYGLDQTDTKIASDHFPKVADFIFEGTQSSDQFFNIYKDITVFTDLSMEMVFIQSREKLGCYQLYNLSGKILRSDKPEHPTASIDISDLDSGMYILRIQANGKYKVEKLIIP